MNQQGKQSVITRLAAWWDRQPWTNPATKMGHVTVSVVALALAAVAFAQNPSPSHDCSSNPLRGVYNPHRLTVLHTCQQITGTVVHASREHDGDLHIQLALAAADKHLLTPKNYSNQSGNLVVEYMPGDPFPVPKKGDRLQIVGTYVLDRQHGGWAEFHPVYSVQPLGSAAQQVEP